MRVPILLLALCGTLLPACHVPAQNLPAGTHDAGEPGPQDVLNAKIAAAEDAMARQDFAAAVTALQAVALERPKEARVQYDLGFALEREGDEAGATAAYEAAIAANPALGEPRVSLGLLDARAGRAEKAHAELAGAAALKDEAPVLRGRALRAMARLDEATQPQTARDELMRAVQLTGEAPDDILLGADLAAQAGDDADAEAAYRRALAQQPVDVDAIAGLAHVLVKQKKNAEAERVLADALKTNPSDPRLISQLAVLYAAEEKVALAIPLVEQLRASRDVYAKDAQMTGMLAHLYEMNGEYAKAETLYRTLTTLDATDPEVLDALGTVLVKEQKFGEAQVVLERSVAMRSRFATQQDWGAAEEHLGYAASKNNQPQIALDALKARDTVLPSSPSSLFLEAISYDALHENKEATQMYKAFLAAAAGKFVNEEFEARHRLVALANRK
jgi:Flp pilus assembly protein TadD